MTLAQTRDAHAMEQSISPPDARNDSPLSDESLAVRKRRIKAHRKSRGGCLMCKTRKVKCCEKKPRCANCVKMGDECVYASTQEKQQLVRAQLPQTVSSTGFSLQDLRFFHSFLTASYPSFPFETDRAWTCEIPIIAQKYGFLNDAILALGAGHLHATTNLDVADTVQKYRFSALQGINSEDNFDLPNAVDKNDSDRATAVLAAIYALAFTSLHMGDPIGHFMVLVRGCSAVTRRMVESGFTSPLFPQGEENLSVRPHMDVMRKRMGNAMPLPTEVIDAARASLCMVEECCDFLPFEQDFLNRMKSVVAVTSGPIEAFNHYTELWNLLVDLSPEEFEHFNASQRLTLLVLQAHFLALEIVVRPWLQASGSFVNGDSKLLRYVLGQFPRESTTVDAALSMQLIWWPKMLLEQSAALTEADLRARVFASP